MRSWWASATYFLAALLVGSCAMGLLLDALSSADVSTVNDVTLVFLLLAVPIVMGLILARRISVRIEGNDVLVVNPFRTYRFARQELRAVELGRNNYVVGAGRSLPMLQLRVRGHATPIQVVASIRVSDSAREQAKRGLLATRQRRAA